MTEDKLDRRVKSLVAYWPVLVLVATGITGYLQLKWTVADLKKDNDDFQANVQAHRSAQTQKDVAEEHRLTSMEKDIECLRKNVESATRR